MSEIDELKNEMQMFPSNKRMIEIANRLIELREE